jgi:hypothetical protein
LAAAVAACVTILLQGGWAFLDLEKSDGEDEDEEQSSEGFNPGSDAEEEEESSEDISDEVRLRLQRVLCCAECGLTVLVQPEALHAVLESVFLDCAWGPVYVLHVFELCVYCVASTRAATQKNRRRAAKTSAMRCGCGCGACVSVQQVALYAAPWSVVGL